MSTIGMDARQHRDSLSGDELGMQYYSSVRGIVQRRRIVVLNKKIPTRFTARGVFADLRARVAKDVGKMNQQEPGRYRLDPLWFDQKTHRFSILKERADGTVVAQAIFDLGNESITVKRQEGDQTPCIVFQVVPEWDRNTGTCRRVLYDDQGSFADIDDADFRNISELALDWLTHEDRGPSITATNTRPS